MKIVARSYGSKKVGDKIVKAKRATIRISKREWLDIGKKAGYFEEGSKIVQCKGCNRRMRKAYVDKSGYCRECYEAKAEDVADGAREDRAIEGKASSSKKMSEKSQSFSTYGVDWEEYLLTHPKDWRQIPSDDIKYNTELWKKAIIMTANKSGGQWAKVILGECPLENVKNDPGLWQELIYIEPSLLSECPLPEVTQDQGFLAKLKNSQEVNSIL